MADEGGDSARRAAAFPAGASGLAAGCWGLLLGASILTAGLKLRSHPAGWAALGLIGGGFLLFTLARASLGGLDQTPSCCAPLLSAKMRLLYWAGYALMFAGVAVTGLASVIVLGR